MCVDTVIGRDAMHRDLRLTALGPVREGGGDSDWYGYCVDDPVNRVDAWGLEDSWWDGAGGRIVRSGLEGMGTGAISGAGAGTLAGGVGAVPGAVVGASVGLPVGLLKGVGEEVYQQYWGGSVRDTAKELSDTMSEQATARREWSSR